MPAQKSLTTLEELGLPRGTASGKKSRRKRNRRDPVPDPDSDSETEFEDVEVVRRSSRRYDDTEPQRRPTTIKRRPHVHQTEGLAQQHTVESPEPVKKNLLDIDVHEAVITIAAFLLINYFLPDQKIIELGAEPNILFLIKTVVTVIALFIVKTVISLGII